MKNETCLWKSPAKGGVSSLVVDLSEKFENKYGLNIFSDVTEKSDIVVVNPSDLEFSPQVQIFMDKEISTKENIVIATANAVIVPTEVSTSHSSSKSTDSTVTASPVITHVTVPKTPTSYLDYKGSSFGQTSFEQNSSTKTIASNKAFYSFNPWILSDGIPNFAKNAPVTTEESSKKRERESIEKAVDINNAENSSSGTNKRQSIDSVTNTTTSEPTYTSPSVAEVDTQASNTTVQDTPSKASASSQSAPFQSPEKQLLEEIREESRRSEEVTRRIVEAIVSGGR